VQGGLKPGDRLPSERELATQHGAARNTAREAITILRNEGLVDAQHGKGAFVPGSARPSCAWAPRGTHGHSRRETGLSPFQAELLQQGRRGHSDCTSVQRVRPPEDVAQRLGVSAKAKTVVERENWYFAEDTPVQVCWTYIPVGNCGRLSPGPQCGARPPGASMPALKTRATPLASIREEIRARMPTPVEAKGLATLARCPRDRAAPHQLRPQGYRLRGGPASSCGPTSWRSTTRCPSNSGRLAPVPRSQPASPAWRPWLCFGGPTSYGSSWPSGALHPPSSSSFRLALGALVLTVFSCGHEATTCPGAGPSWASSHTGRHLRLRPFRTSLFAYGEQRVDSSIAGLLNATTPLWTALIAMAVRLERDVTPTRIAGLVVGFSGHPRDLRALAGSAPRS